ncbi:regulatory protein, luxR family [Ferrimonas sediminum]|uniref:Regulatory protein, luxR family n=1 Tax=Ferrimonas sediminum TaxID=718193 RepID=A0A1G9BHP2_9GAMM|nr:LuxR C-terminal-related transcriptional regulator [Ferrimonas sediminum]SDK38385.1 regulatory protein, luxR family [Ferrimonas sediminum]
MTQADSGAGIAEVLQQGCDELGVKAICYCYDLDEPMRWGRRLKSTEHVIRNLAKRRQLFASSGQALSLWRRKMPFYRHMETVIEQLLSQQVCVWPQRTMPAAMTRHLQAQGIGGVMTVSVCCPVSPRLRGRFMLLAETPEQLSELAQQRGRVVACLERLQTRIALDYGRDIHPLVDCNVVSPLAVYILSGIAQGQDREQVSSQLSLTLRGVDYHISVLKQVLGAKNIAQLVYEAGKLRLV